VLRPAHDVHQSHAVLEADLVEHLPEVGGGRGVHQRLVSLRTHGGDHAESCGIGSWGGSWAGRCPSLVPYAAVTRPKDRAAAGRHSCCHRSRAEGHAARVRPKIGTNRRPVVPRACESRWGFEPVLPGGSYTFYESEPYAPPSLTRTQLGPNHAVLSVLIRKHRPGCRAEIHGS